MVQAVGYSAVLTETTLQVNIHCYEAVDHDMVRVWTETIFVKRNLKAILFHQ